jgi:hypothetical protein
MTEPVFSYVLSFRLKGRRVWWTSVLTLYELWVSCIVKVLCKLVLPVAGGLKTWVARSAWHCSGVEQLHSLQNPYLRFTFICVYSYQSSTSITSFLSRIKGRAKITGWFFVQTSLLDFKTQATFIIMEMNVLISQHFIMCMKNKVMCLW